MAVCGYRRFAFLAAMDFRAAVAFFLPGRGFGFDVARLVVARFVPALGAGTPDKSYAS